MEPKFRIGDKVVRNAKEPDQMYHFMGSFGGRNAKKGDTFTISAVGESEWGNDIIYSVKGAYMQQPNWSSMEKYFDLFKETNWKRRLENGNV